MNKKHKRPTVEDLIRQGLDIKITKCPPSKKDTIEYIHTDFKSEIIYRGRISKKSGY